MQCVSTSRPSVMLLMIPRRGSFALSCAASMSVTVHCLVSTLASNTGLWARMLTLRHAAWCASSSIVFLCPALSIWLTITRYRPVTEYAEHTTGEEDGVLSIQRPSFHAAPLGQQGQCSRDHRDGFMCWPRAFLHGDITRGALPVRNASGSRCSSGTTW